MKHYEKAAAAAMSLLLAVQSAPMPVTTVTAADSAPVISMDFEDGDTTGWSNRGENDTTEISVTDEDAVSGTKALLASGRSKDWNGPAFRIDGVLEPNTEYLVNVSVKGKWYTNATMSWQYSMEGGEPNYANLATKSDNGWVRFENIKISYTTGMKDVYVYFEGGQDDILIDDFTITEVPAVPIQTDIPSLKDVYHDSFKVGTALIPSDMSSKSFMQLLEKHFSDSITVGNQMKPEDVLDYKNTLANYEETGDDETIMVSFAKAAPVLDYCRDHKIPVRVHTLVWHSQTPDWFFKEGFDADADFVSADKMLKRMESYIKNYFEKLIELYPDVDFYACDVVNEAFNEQGQPREAGSYSQGHGTSSWVSIFGDNSFIEPAFTYARMYAPATCKLYYNDYNEWAPGKHDSILALANDLKEKGLIDGIGMQSHLDVRQGSDAWPSISAYDKALKNFTDTGLDVQITELDATIPDQTEKSLETQAQYYSDLMDVILKYSDKISALIFWGITDPNSWRADQYPLLFDENYQAKPAFDAIVDDVQYTTGASTTTTTGTTTTTTKTDVSGTTGSTSGNGGMRGDLTLDGLVDVKDAVLLARYVGNDGVELSAAAMANAEVDGQDGVNVDDLSYLLQGIAGLKEL